MKEIFQEERKKQERNILNIISGNFEITMNEIKNLKQEISELKSSLDFTEEVLEKKVEKHERRWREDIRYLRVPGRPKLCTWQTCRTRRQIT